MKKKQYMLGMCFILLGMITGCGDLSIKQEKEILQGTEEVHKEELLYNTAFEKALFDLGKQYGFEFEVLRKG